MNRQELLQEIRTIQTFFNRATDCLTEEDSNFQATPDSYTVASHIAHVAQCIDWFIEGAFRPEGFDLSFEEHIAFAKSITSIEKARTLFDQAIENAYSAFSSASEADLTAPIAEGPIMGGAPRYSVVSAMCDHTSHHRGALAVYSRLLGKEPKMPYQ